MNGQASLDRATIEGERIGFFGKLPTHGDFVSTGLARPLQEALDIWLKSGLQALQQSLGQSWERQFRTMPTWRFVMEPDIWAPATVAGVIVPSLDRVGRSFPLVLAAQVPGFSGDPRQLCLDDTWFTAVEAIAESASRADFDIATFTERMKRLRTLRPGDFEFDDQRNGAAGRPAGHNLFWWRIDPQDRQMRGFRTAGAPDADTFLKLLADEDHVGHHRNDDRQPDMPVRQVAPPAPEPEPPPPRKAARPKLTLVRTPPPIALHYSMASHPGTRLTLNADSLLTAAPAGIFAVADGIGDGNGAIEAGRIAINALSEIGEPETFDDVVQDIKGKLGRAHGLLQSNPASASPEPPRASIVVLAARFQQAAFIWSGDARGYLLRDGMMRCLTRDHVAIGLKRSLSRCLGRPGPLMPEIALDSLQPGDRFLLCSNPLARSLPERSIAEILLSTGLDESAAVLAQEALIANCRDNLSAIVIDAVVHDIG